MILSEIVVLNEYLLINYYTILIFPNQVTRTIT